MKASVRLFGGRLKINLLMIPAVIALFVLGRGDVLLYYIPAVIVHEWAHVLVSVALGMTVTEMELFPFGCAAKLECFAMSRVREIFVAAAGPLANMALACAVFFVDKYAFEITVKDRIIASNLALAAVNLLPALPLDGGRIARAVFASFMGYRRATRLMAAGGIFFAVVIVGVGVWAAVEHALNVSFFIMGVFLCLAAVKELKSAPYTLIRDFSGKRQALDKRKTMHINRFAAMQTQPLRDIMREFEAGKYNIVTVLDKDMGVMGELDEREILGGMLQKGTHVTLGSLYRQKPTPS
jgi:stage IV sporulation protein FB